jgi:hypothetical protein
LSETQTELTSEGRDRLRWKEVSKYVEVACPASVSPSMTPTFVDVFKSPRLTPKFVLGEVSQEFCNEVVILLLVIAVLLVIAIVIAIAIAIATIVV